MTKVGIHFIFLPVVIIIAAATACSMGPESATGDTAFQTETVIRRDIVSSVQATGVIRTKPGAEVKVGSRIPGRVERLFFNIGDSVKKGQLLVRLEQNDLRAKVDESKMKLRAAEANLEFTRKNVLRMQNLYSKDFVSREKVDLAVRDFKAAEAQAEQIAESIRFSEAQMSYADVHAPISGVIAELNVQQGETVSASSNILTILDLDKLEAYAYVDETDIGRIKPGLEVSLSVDSFPEKEFTGKVAEVYPKAAIRDNVIYYVTSISLKNSDGTLKPEMTLNATIFLARRQNVLSVPNRAIKREGGRGLIYLLEKGRPVRKTIRTGWRDSNYTEVVEGVKEGELIITGESAKTEKE